MVVQCSNAEILSERGHILFIADLTITILFSVFGKDWKSDDALSPHSKFVKEHPSFKKTETKFRDLVFFLANYLILYYLVKYIYQSK